MELLTYSLVDQAVIAQTTIPQAFASAAETILEPINLILILSGTLLGLIMGILPGLGGIVALSLLIPLTFGMDPLVAFMLLVAVRGGTNFGGSITAILLNTPGGAPNAATLLDGYPMTRNGEGERAISASAVASATGAVLGLMVLLLLIPVLREISLLFGPAEIFWLGLWGITFISVVVKGRVLPGVIAGALGMMFAMHGMNLQTANVRWSYGVTWMWDGFKLIPALIGLFAISEMLKLVSREEKIAKEEDVNLGTGRVQGIKDVYIHRGIFLRSCIIGIIIGTIPGIGSTAANFIAYFQASQTSPDPESFGTGEVRGVIASEASNDAKEGGALIPTLALGIPGGAGMAVLLGAFILHGIRPGPAVFQDHLDLVAIIILSLIISNILTSLIGLITIKHLVKITRIDTIYIAPVIICVCFLGAYAVDNTVFDIYIALFFGLLGFSMMKIDMSRVPMILGMVLAPIVEDNYFRAIQISDTRGGGHEIFIESRLSHLLIALIIISFLVPYIRKKVRERGLLP